MTPLQPILVADLLPIIDDKLITLLKQLSQEDWEKPTLAPLNEG